MDTRSLAKTQAATRDHESLREYCDRMVADWPELTQEQVDRLRAIFRSARREAA